MVRVSGDLDTIALNDLLNELRNAGAEALAVDGTRIVAATVVAQSASALEVDGTPLDRTFTLTVIGDPDGLVAALQRPGGIVTQLEQFVRATITVSPSDTLRLPATDRDLFPKRRRRSNEGPHLMDDLIARAIDAATGSGAAYADVRVIEHQAESLTVKNGSLAAASSDRSAGFGVRALVDGAWGFASSQDLDLAEAERRRSARGGHRPRQPPGGRSGRRA